MASGARVLRGGGKKPFGLGGFIIGANQDFDSSLINTRAAFDSVRSR